jgi:hypothetical protein
MALVHYNLLMFTTLSTALYRAKGCHTSLDTLEVSPHCSTLSVGRIFNGINSHVTGALNWVITINCTAWFVLWRNCIVPSPFCQQP